jgi:hypothetical protein
VLQPLAAVTVLTSACSTVPFASTSGFRVTCTLVLGPPGAELVGPDRVTEISDPRAGKTRTLSTNRPMYPPPDGRLRGSCDIGKVLENRVVPAVLVAITVMDPDTVNALDGESSERVPVVFMVMLVKFSVSWMLKGIGVTATSMKIVRTIEPLNAVTLMS